MNGEILAGKQLIKCSEMMGSLDQIDTLHQAYLFRIILKHLGSCS